MTILFIILIILASVVLSLFVLVQNPKGGGLAGNIAGFSTQFMGVKQTNDVLEKGTWIFAAIIGILCIISTIFIPGSHSPRTQTPTEQTAPGSNQNQTQNNTGAPTK
jgi:preprotein translocase subunit SecG